MTYLWIGLDSAAGGVLRYFGGEQLARFAGTSWPRCRSACSAYGLVVMPLVVSCAEPHPVPTGAA